MLYYVFISLRFGLYTGKCFGCFSQWLGNEWKPFIVKNWSVILKKLWFYCKILWNVAFIVSLTPTENTFTIAGKPNCFLLIMTWIPPFKVFYKWFCSRPELCSSENSEFDSFVFFRKLLCELLSPQHALLMLWMWSKVSAVHLKRRQCF